MTFDVPDDLITPVYRAPTRAPKAKPTPAVVKAERPCDDEDCFEASGSPPDAQTDEPEATERPATTSTTGWHTFKVSYETATNATLTTATTSTLAPTTRPMATRPATTARPSTTRVPPRVYPTPPFVIPQPVTPRRPRPTPYNYDDLWNRSKIAEREELERRKEHEGESIVQDLIQWFTVLVLTFKEKTKRVRERERITSETAENTALIIGIVAGALIAVILVVLLVLKLKSRSQTAYKVDERKDYGKAPPSHSNSNAALLNTGTTGSAAPVKPAVLNINPALVNLDKKPSPSKKSAKDIKEWYV